MIDVNINELLKANNLARFSNNKICNNTLLQRKYLTVQTLLSKSNHLRFGPYLVFFFLYLFKLNLFILFYCYCCYFDYYYYYYYYY